MRWLLQLPRAAATDAARLRCFRLKLR